MNFFNRSQRIIINKGPLEGLAGTVYRMFAKGKGGWVMMDSRPDHLAMDRGLFPFLPGDQLGRANLTLVCPTDCIAEPGREVDEETIQRSKGGCLYSFHGKDGFYALPFASDDIARQNAERNPGTLKVVNEVTQAVVFEKR